jgi:hypothetical protein
MLSGKRCLLILDAPQAALDPLLPSGRTSILFTSEPVHVLDNELSLASARALVSASRFAEAYEVLYQICEHWGRQDEANALRVHFGPAPSEQLRLF